MSAAPIPRTVGASSTYQPLGFDSLTGATSPTPVRQLQDIAQEAAGDQVHHDDLWGITVRLISASDLMVGDVFTKSSDPYVLFDCDGEIRKSRILKKTLNPEWNETFTWVSATQPKNLKINVFDWDQVGSHDPLGHKFMDLAAVTNGLTYEGDVRLEGVKHGMIKVYIESTRIPNIAGRSSGLDLTGVKNVADIVSLVELKLVGAEKLGAKDDSVFKAKNDPFAVVQFGLSSFKTATIPRTNDPTWNQLCPLWITNSDNNASAVLKIQIWDYERIGKARLLGNAYLRPRDLVQNHAYDVKLPLTLENAETDAQLGVLLQDLKVSHESSSNAQQPLELNSPHNPTTTAAHHGHGLVHLHFMIKPREQVEKEFYTHIIDDYDSDGSKTMSLAEITHMLATIGVKLTPEEIAQAFEEADTTKSGGLGEKELALLFRTKIFEQNNVLRTLFSVIVYGKDALDSLLMKGCLTGVNDNFKLEENAVIDNEGVKILVQERESGLVVSENIPAYIKSALVLLNRTIVGQAASAKIKGTIRSLTIRQGQKMDNPKSKKDIPNFIKIHQLNVAEIEKTVDEYNTFNEFFYRKLKPGVRPISEPDNLAHATSPADCRMMVFQSIEESKRLWIKGHHFNIQNLLAGWDTDGKKTALFNGGQLCIARLAPQDYHRFHYPVTGKLNRRYLIAGDYNTVNPIAIRQDVNVYTENKRCICPIETQEFGLVLLIAVAATMVGSIGFNCTCSPAPLNAHGKPTCCEDGRCMSGKEVKKGDDAGWFAFGGSTTLVLFQPNAIQFDGDLLKNSSNQLETLVKVGSSLGKSTGKYHK